MARVGDEPPDVGTDDWLSAPLQSGLPPGFRLLCIGASEPDWVGLTLQLDAVGCHDPRLKWTSEAADAMSLLRNETFDCLVVGTHSNSVEVMWDAESLVRAIRASGCNDPLVLLMDEPSDDLAGLVAQLNGELLVSRLTWNSRALVKVIQRSIRNVETARENHQLAVANHRRLVRERDEAGHLLRQQRDIISELEVLADGRMSAIAAEANTDLACIDEAFGHVPQDGSKRTAIPVPDEIKRFYQELLRTYVIMGSGNLGGEIADLARILAEFGLSPRDTLSLHLERVEEVVRGLGNRSTRHVMARADLLALELIIHLGECYMGIREERTES
jgi:hypothetical protein